VPNFSTQTVQRVGAFVSSYRSAVANNHTGIELATRPAVHELLLSLLLDVTGSTGTVEVVHDQFVSGTRNKPDWALYEAEGGGLHFYGDHKPASAQALQLSPGESAQIDRYLEMGAPVFVFDGVEFLFMKRLGGVVDRVSLFPRAVLGDGAVTELNPIVLDRLRAWLKAPGFRAVSLNELVDQAASRGRLMRAELKRLLDLDRGTGDSHHENRLIIAMSDLQDSLSQSGRVTFDDSDRCADFIAQILAFGLVYAHFSVRELSDEPVLRRAQLNAHFLGLDDDDQTDLPPFAEIVTAMADEFNHDDGFLGYWYQDAVRYFSNVDEIRSSAEVDYHTLFESFLQRYDPLTRFDFGAFYTPTALSDWLAKQVDDVSRIHFGSAVEDVAHQVIDPCCGTGGILESFLKRPARDTGEVDFIGIDIMPVPYALAQFRLSHLSEMSNRKVRLFLADTLDDSLVDDVDLSPGLLSREITGARSAIGHSVRVVVGNAPAYLTASQMSGRSQSDSDLARFRNIRTNRSASNIDQALNNESVRFLAWSATKVVESGFGIVALILPGSIATAPSYAGMRKWLVSNFDELRIVQLDADGRTGQRTDSLFRAKQGRLALFATRFSRDSQGEVRESPATIKIASVAHASLVEKIEFLQADGPVQFARVDVSGDREARFIQSDMSDQSDWNSYHPIFENWVGTTPLFLNRSSGVKLAPSALLFHTDDRMLRRRSSEIGRKNSLGFETTVEVLREKWFVGQTKPVPASKFPDSVRTALGVACRESDAVVRYTFRPFLEGSALLDDALIAALKRVGDGTRIRGELRAAFAQGAVGIAIAPDPPALGSDLDRFAVFVWSLPDNDLVARGNAMIYTDKWVSQTTSGGSVVESNIDSEHVLKELLADDLQVLFYTYAILSSLNYRKRFKSNLFRSSSGGHVPRIPVMSKVQSVRLAGLGQQLAELEDMSRPGLHRESQMLEQRRSVYLDGSKLWPAEFKLVKSAIDPERGAITLFDQNGPSLTISGVPSTVLTMRIVGHDVVKKWLREYSYRYLRRSFSILDARKLIDLLLRIEAQQALLKTIDAVLAEVWSGEGPSLSS
jgi:hypothetical protein